MGSDLEKDAYFKLFRAFACRNHSDWKHQQLLKTVRAELGLSGDFHDEVFDSVMNDTEVHQLSQASNSIAQQQEGCQFGENNEQQQMSPSGMGMGALAKCTPYVPPQKQQSRQSINRNRGSKSSPDGQSRKSRGQQSQQQLVSQENQVGDQENNSWHPLIGRKVRRWWPANNETGDAEDWYTGVFADFNKESGEFCIIYDYGKETESLEWFNIKTADSGEFEILDDVFVPGVLEQQKQTHQMPQSQQPPKKRKQAEVPLVASHGIIHSSDEEEEIEHYRQRVCNMNFVELKGEEDQVVQQQQQLRVEIETLKYALKLQSMCHDVQQLRNEEIRLLREQDNLAHEISQLRYKLSKG
eukprot:TRINITY_DN10709_c0_g2_i1.p1 TRINITY_DN10709_c0_g2~~TRINITY_DN10709_c0_g2_i1.p1  ORF type:complete len:355 (-),score=67.33 TRINITY_DN10709_c0_g2_i1:387-1451(-)